MTDAITPDSLRAHADWMRKRTYTMTAANLRDEAVRIESANKAYPYEDGEFTVLGPQVFTTPDRSVICYQGVNYIPQPKPEPEVYETWDDVPHCEYVLDRLGRKIYKSTCGDAHFSEPLICIVDYRVVRWHPNSPFTQVVE